MGICSCVGSHPPSGYFISGTQMQTLLLPLLCLLPLAAEPGHTKDSPGEPGGLKGAALWCRTARRMLCGDTASPPCPLLLSSLCSIPAVPMQQERCCCSSIHILHWRCTAAGMAVLEQAEGVTKPTPQCWTSADPQGSHQHSNPNCICKGYKRNTSYFEFHTRETSLCPFTPKALVSTENVCSPPDTNT